MVLGSWAKTEDGTILFQAAFPMDSANDYISELIIMVGMSADNREKDLLQSDEYWYY